MFISNYSSVSEKQHTLIMLDRYHILTLKERKKSYITTNIIVPMIYLKFIALLHYLDVFMLQ
jgi:hypothetical protein